MGEVPAGEVCEYVGFDAFSRRLLSERRQRRLRQDGSGPGLRAARIPHGRLLTFTPDFLHQLVAVRKLLDQTGLPLAEPAGFLGRYQHGGGKVPLCEAVPDAQPVAIDNVFKADANGNYLTQPAKITDHLPVLMAALKLKADDIAAIMDFAPVAGLHLTLPNVSSLYRYSLLAKTPARQGPAPARCRRLCSAIRSRVPGIRLRCLRPGARWRMRALRSASSTT